MRVGHAGVSEHHYHRRRHRHQQHPPSREKNKKKQQLKKCRQLAKTPANLQPLRIGRRWLPPGPLGTRSFLLLPVCVPPLSPVLPRHHQRCRRGRGGRCSRSRRKLSSVRGMPPASTAATAVLLADYRTSLHRSLHAYARKSGQYTGVRSDLDRSSTRCKRCCSGHLLCLLTVSILRKLDKLNNPAIEEASGALQHRAIRFLDVLGYKWTPCSAWKSGGARDSVPGQESMTKDTTPSCNPLRI